MAAPTHFAVLGARACCPGGVLASVFPISVRQSNFCKEVCHETGQDSKHRNYNQAVAEHSPPQKMEMELRSRSN